MSYGNQNKQHYETKIYFYNVFILCFMVINLVIWDTSKGYHMTQIYGRSSSPVYIPHHIESARALGELKHGSKQDMSNIFDTLVNNNAFLSHDKFHFHKKHVIGFFVHLSLRITLRDTLREEIQDALMWIDLDDEINKPMIHDIEDKEDSPTGKQRIVIPAFDLYSKEVGACSGHNRVTIFAYEIRTSPDNSTMLKNVLCKLSEANFNDIKCIHYGLDNMTQNNTMREITIQQNTFLDTVKIVPVFEITDNEKEQVQDILRHSQFFTGMKPIRK